MSRRDPRSGYIGLRSSPDELNRETILAFLTELVETDPRNALPEGDNPPIWEAPVVGIAAADDPLFKTLQTPGVVGPIHVLPDYWLPSARSVISFFLPFSRQIKDSYGKKSLIPPLEWVSGRLNGEVFVNVTRRALTLLLQKAGGRAAAPNLDPRYKAVDLLPMWSERHVAFVAGVGTFGLHAGLLTSKGAAGRIGSVVTDLALPVTPRPYTEVYEYCPYPKDGTCGACIIRCPVQAIDADGKDHRICLTNSELNIRPAYGAWGYHSCGHCQNNLPCADRIPSRAELRAASAAPASGTVDA